MKTFIISIWVDVVTRIEAVDLVSKWVSSNNKNKYICVSNVHMCMEAKKNELFADVVNSADLVVPDGKPLSIIQKKVYKIREAEQLRGEDLMLSLCEAADKNGFKVGLYGSSDSVLEKLEGVLISKFKSLDIAYKHSPPYRELTESEKGEVVQDINKSGIDILFVGLGCPKQERWMLEHKDKVNAVSLGVGAAFDFVSGNKRSAPSIFKKLGIEWLYRLCSEPTRLWRRYLYTNTAFLLSIPMVFLKKSSY